MYEVSFNVLAKNKNSYRDFTTDYHKCSCKVHKDYLKTFFIEVLDNNDSIDGFCHFAGLLLAKIYNDFYKKSYDDLEYSESNHTKYKILCNGDLDDSSLSILLSNCISFTEYPYEDAYVFEYSSYSVFENNLVLLKLLDNVNIDTTTISIGQKKLRKLLKKVVKNYE